MKRKGIIPSDGGRPSTNNRTRHRIHVAVLTNDNEELKRILKKSSPNPNIQNGGGNTPLHVAADVLNREAARILLNHGVRTDIKNDSGKTAWDIASDNGRYKEEPIARMIENAQNGFRPDDGIKNITKGETNNAPPPERLTKILNDPKTTLQDLRGYYDPANQTTFIMQAALNDCFDKVIEIALRTPDDHLTIDDFMQKDEHMGNTLKFLGGHDKLAQAFNPRLWVNRKNEMAALWQHAQKTPYANQIDISSVISQIDRIALRQKMKPLNRNIRRGPS